LGGFKAQGRTAKTALELLEDALAIEGAGAFALLLEAIPPELAKIITKKLRIPVLSIGAGAYCDGQLLIVSDMLGIFDAFTPKFVKKYSSLSEDILKAFKVYADDVKQGRFPEEKHTYKMFPGELEKLEKLI
jgi:3-methyl-2-oxobutanoate hydroxymethyltransferase